MLLLQKPSTRYAHKLLSGDLANSEQLLSSSLEDVDPTVYQIIEKVR
jgi:hypothetical protein